jgi:type I restriction enzyme R subunit
MNEGYMAACETAYNRITLGKDLEQSIDGDKKSFTLQYIDWKETENNVFHVTEEYSVMRSMSKEHYRPDLVLFINGIPLCIIECKRPDMKEPLSQAISQHLRSQQDDGIRSLYVYAQLLVSVATGTATYATNGTTEEFWAIWRESEKLKVNNEKIKVENEGTNFSLFTHHLLLLKNTPLTILQKNKLFADRFRYVRSYFDALESREILPTVQDEYLYSLCRPERLMDLIFNFILFDNGEKKIARYQQYFVVKKSIQRILQIEGGKRQGGVVWHTQGSGKSLTMVMLAQAIALEKQIRNPKIILVTDRIDLDDQITGTFRKCGIFVENATTGQRLVELLQSKSDAVITTVINKFEAAVKKIPHPLESPDIFVLVDEGHRTQHGTFNIEMQKTLPNACFIAFTGTPLFKKDKSTAAKFGGMIDTYTVDQAVKDKAVVPLLYEGRFAKQTVHEKPIDEFFGNISEPLTD